MTDPAPRRLMEHLDPSETWSDTARRAAQRERLGGMLPEVVRTNPFYRAKLGASATVDTWPDLPFTTKTELSLGEADGWDPRPGR